MVDKESKGMPVKYPEFAQRVQIGMEKNGLTTNDVKAALNITYEMARRYTLGHAMPRQEKMDALAKLLGVDPAELQYGAKARPSKDQAIAMMNSASWPFTISRERFDRLPKDEKERIDGLIDHTITAWESRTQTKSRKTS